MADRILLVLGTRPEAIKLAPVYRALQADERFEVLLAVTGQHRELLTDTLTALALTPDYNLALMRAGQSQFDLVGAMLPALGAVMASANPAWVVVQGDTATAFVGALAGYLRQTRVAHIEAGLRTGDKYGPFPEEVYRRLVADIADLHFAPTARAAQNLRTEGIPSSQIHVTGNTAIDSLHWVLANLPDALPEDLASRVPDLPTQRLVLVTCHRRESFGQDMAEILRAVAELAARFPAVLFIFPVHPNPEVLQPAHALLGGLANVLLTAPLQYPGFAHLLSRSYLVMTDSGGIQEEAVELGKPTVVMRKVTERQEGIEAGTALLAGVDAATIVACVSELLGDRAAYERLAVRRNVYGDGTAASSIVEILAAQ
jgi:UDP-N-acetylglucosamine 2-epimerase (non-hydrolysing)